MPPLTNDQLYIMNFGYLMGSDLMQWCPAQLLIKRYEVNANSLLDGCVSAYGEVIRMLNSRYAIENEISANTVSGSRDILCVKITAILAIRNILGSMAQVSDLMMDQFKWADQTLKDVRNGFTNLILPQADRSVYSDSFLVSSNFRTLG